MSTKNLSNRIDALKTLGIADLRKEFAQVTGRTTNSGDREWLVQEIGKRLLLGTKGSAKPASEKADGATRRAPAQPVAKDGTSPFTKDERLPEPGSTITVTHKGKDVDLDRGEVAIPAISAKSRIDQSVPLRSDLKAALAAHRPTDALPAACVFPPRVYPTLRTFKKDLVAAGLATEDREKGVPSGQTTFDAEDESGRCLDFHSLRMTFVTSLVAAGVHPRVAQALARHAKIETTMRVYTDVHSLDLRGAVERLARPDMARGHPAVGA